MKKLMPLLLVFTSLSAFGQSYSCEMSSGGNTTQLRLITNSSGVLVQLAEEEPDQCFTASNRDFDFLTRCGSDEDSTFFGIRGTSGRVFEGSTNIAQLRRCKRL